MHSSLWDNPEPVYGWKGACSHKGVLFNDNPGKKLRQQKRSKMPLMQKLIWK